MKEQKMKVLNFTVVFEPLEDGGYIVEVPALPGFVTYGESLNEAREMAKDAIRCHCEGLLKDGDPIPTDKPLQREPVKGTITIELAYA